MRIGERNETICKECQRPSKWVYCKDCLADLKAAGKVDVVKERVFLTKGAICRIPRAAFQDKEKYISAYLDGISIYLTGTLDDLDGPMDISANIKIESVSGLEVRRTPYLSMTAPRGKDQDGVLAGVFREDYPGVAIAKASFPIPGRGRGLVLAFIPMTDEAERASFDGWKAYQDAVKDSEARRQAAGSGGSGFGGGRKPGRGAIHRSNADGWGGRG